MPLKIVPPRHKMAKNLYIRGSHLGVAVDQSSGTNRHSLARSIKKRIEEQIERGEYRTQKPPESDRREPTFLSAAIAYMEAGKSKRYIRRLLAHFGETPLSQIDQAAIDNAAMTLYPRVSNASRNAYVHTPVSAILHHANLDIRVRRPPGAKGRVIKDWLRPEDAFGIIDAADAIDAEFGALLTFLLYTGPRIGGALNLEREDVRLEDGAAWARPQKGQSPMEIKLNEQVRARLAKHLAVIADRRRVFRWHYGGHLKFLLIRAKLAYLLLACPVRRPTPWKEPPNRLKWVTFHIWRHTWATWMRKYAGATVDDLVDTHNWKDRRSAQRYVHATFDGAWDFADKLPSPNAGKIRESGNEQP
jgi:integrase